MGIHEMITGIPEEPIKHEPIKVKDLEDDRVYVVKFQGYGVLVLNGSILKRLYDEERILNVFGQSKLSELDFDYINNN